MNNTIDSYVTNELKQAITKLNKSFCYDRHSGAFYFEGVHCDRFSDGQPKQNKVQVYATPFWEGAKGICLSVMDENGDFLFQETDTTFTEDRLTFVPKVDAVSYLEVLNKMVSKLKIKLV